MSNDTEAGLPKLPEPYEMLPDSLMPVADEWYKQICERAGYVDRLTISGDLVSAIKAAIGEPRYTADQMRAYAREALTRAPEADRAGGGWPIDSEFPAPVADALRQFASVLEAGTLDGSLTYTPSALREWADEIDAGASVSLARKRFEEQKYPNAPTWDELAPETQKFWIDHAIRNPAASPEPAP